MRVRVTKVRTVNPSTRIEDQTVPIKVDKRPRWRKILSRWLRWAWEAIKTPEGPSEDGIEGILVAFKGWDGGRVLYDPFPKDVDACVDFDVPLVLVLDDGQVWHTSPITMVMSDPDGLPNSVETKSSLYKIIWVDKPMGDGRVAG